MAIYYTTRHCQYNYYRHQHRATIVISFIKLRFHGFLPLTFAGLGLHSSVCIKVIVNSFKILKIITHKA